VIAAIAALALASCTKEASVEVNPGASHAVGFSTYSPRSLTKAGSTLVGDADGAGVTHIFGGFQTIGVFAWNTGEDGKFGETPNFMGGEGAGQKVDLADGGATASSNYTPVKYWPTDGDELTFSAYYPYMVGEDGNVTSGIEVSSNGSKYSFTVNEDVTKQVDFMLADVKSGMTYANSDNGSVDFTFHHMLTRVLFEVKADDDKFTINLKKVFFTAKNSATVSVSYDADKKTTSYNVETANDERTFRPYDWKKEENGTSGGSGLTLKSTEVFIPYAGENAKSSFLMVPQEVPTELFVEYEISQTVNGGTETESMIAKVDLSKATDGKGNTIKRWEDNNYIKYTLSIGPKVIKVSVESVPGWTTINKEQQL